MATCKWCGRYFKDGKGYNSSFFELRQKYCSKRCYLEHEASKNPQQIYYGQEPVRHSGGGFCDYSGLNVPLVAVCNVPPIAFSNVPPQKWLL